MISVHASARRLLAAVTSTAAVLLVLLLGASQASAHFPGTRVSRPFAIALCNFSDQTVQPAGFTPAYYTQMFAQQGGLSVWDYWHDVSYHQIDLTGTNVSAWSVAQDGAGNPLTRGQWINLGFVQRVEACARGAQDNLGNPFNWGTAASPLYWGVVAIYPEARALLNQGGGNIAAGTTNITVSTTQNFPNGTAPFLMDIIDPAPSAGPGTNSNETVLVTAVNTGTNTLTVTRGQGGTAAVAHNNGVLMQVQGDLGRSTIGQDTGPQVNLGGTNFTLAKAILAHESDHTVAAHELGHSIGLQHSRVLSTSNVDYNDCFDLMSAYTCTQRFGTGPGTGTYFGGAGLYASPLGPAAAGVQNGTKGPGLNANSYDRLPTLGLANANITQLAPAGAQQTVALHSVSDTNALQVAGRQLQARVPATNGITTADTPANTTSDFYLFDYRERALWDRAFPQALVEIHLRAPDPGGYLMSYLTGIEACPAPVGTPSPPACQSAGATWGPNGRLTVGGGTALALAGEFADAPNNTYAAVNAINTVTNTATVTVSTSPINVSIGGLSPASAEFGDSVTLSATVTVQGSGAPVPQLPVTLSVGTQSCLAVTNGNGLAQCNITLTQAPGGYTLTATFPATTAYAATTNTSPFTINQEATSVAYTGPASVANDAPATFTATLTDNDGNPVAGRPVRFTIGSGATAQTCPAPAAPPAVTNGSGNVSCTITVAGHPASATSLPVTVDFDGDAFYLPSQDTDTVRLRYYTGRSFGLSASVLGLAPVRFGDTGEISTSQQSTNSASVASASVPFVRASVVGGSVDTGITGSHAVASTTSARVGLPFLPVVSAGTVIAQSDSTCAAATGSTQIANATVGFLPIVVGNPAPNTTLNFGVLKIVLNEQQPVPGADRGLTVNAMRVSSPGLADVIISSAKSDVHNCT